MDPVAEAEDAELDAVGAERVRLDHVRAVADVDLVHLRDEIRLRQVELVERAVEEDAPGIEHRPHRAIADKDAAVEFGEK
jgi:hypothetical protein